MATKTGSGRVGKAVERPPIFARTQRALARNLDRALSAAQNSDSECHAMPVKKFSDDTGIARTTIVKILKGAPVEVATRKDLAKLSSNPDMLTLCRMAAELGVSPAFLLLSPTDWKLLLAAFKNLHSALVSAKPSALKKCLAEKREPANAASSELAYTAIKLSREMYPESEVEWRGVANLEKRNEDALASTNAQDGIPMYVRPAIKSTYDERHRLRALRLKSIPVTANIPPYSEVGNSDDQKLAFALCVMFGYNFVDGSQITAKERL